MKKICVFCGSSYGNNVTYINSIKKLAEELVNNNLALIYGGAKVGLMGELANHILKLNGKVYGIMPRFLIHKEIVHNGLTKLIIVDSMHERKELMEKESDGFIAMPGGLGTLDEIFEMITWGQLNLHKKPCAFLNVNEYYNHIDKFLRNAVSEGFLDEEYKNMIIIETKPDIIIKKFLNYKHPVVDKIEKALTKNKKVF